MTLDEAIKALREGGVQSPEDDARLLFFEIGKIPKHRLVVRDVVCELPELKAAIEKRAAGVPVQYLVGKVGFYREQYEVTPDCLIPREDTELLVEYAVRNIPEGETFIDICTGSGCIAISTLKNTKNTKSCAIDLSEKALDVAKKNSELNGVDNRLELLCADAFDFKPEEPVFAILSNPPYVTNEEYSKLERELYHEPRIAFLGGEDGLDFYRRIIPNCKDKLKENGFFAFEIGYSQKDAICGLAKENGMTAVIHRDLSGNDRLAVLKKA